MDKRVNLSQLIQILEASKVIARAAVDIADIELEAAKDQLIERVTEHQVQQIKRELGDQAGELAMWKSYMGEGHLDYTMSTRLHTDAVVAMLPPRFVPELIALLTFLMHRHGEVIDVPERCYKP